MAEELDIDLSVFATMPDEDLDDILLAIQEGADTPAELLGFDETAINAIENIALGFYRSRLYARAALIFGFALRLDSNRISCWRGLGACAQANKIYRVAELCYTAALERDPKDLISRACLGECFCLDNRSEEGKALLRSFVTAAADDVTYKDFVARARAVLEG